MEKADLPSKEAVPSATLDSGSHDDIEEAASISEKALLRKLDLKLLSALTLLYLLSFLDRSNGIPLVTSYWF